MNKIALPMSVKKLWFFLILAIPINPLWSQCTLSCKTQVNVSIDDTGIATITPAMVAHTSSCSLPLTVDVLDPNGSSLGNTLDCSFVGQLLMVSVSASNGYSCMGSILLEDKRKPVINCKNDTLVCNAATSPSVLGIPTVFDNCDFGITPSYTDQIDNPDCHPDYSAVITRTWTAVDNSNNLGTCVQTILVQRASLTEVEFPDNWDGLQNPTIHCANPNTDPSFTGIPMINGLPIESYCELMVFYEDTTIDNCEGDYIIQRKWKVFDWCAGSFVEQVQIIKVVDETGPIINCPPDLTFGTDGIDCTGTVNLQNASATDDCSSPSNLSITTTWAFGNGTGTFSNIPLGEHLVYYTATDDCGNTSTCETTVEIIDDDPPVPVCQSDLVVALNADTTKIYASAFNKASFDNCALDTNFMVRRMEDTLFTECIYFNCGDLDSTIMVVFKVCDTTGLCNSCMVSVELQDKTNPSIVCPADVSIDCSAYPPDPAQTGMATASDNCGLDTIYYSDTENLNLCNVGTITRVWTAVDLDGRMASCTQTITIGDSIPPVYSFPLDLTVACLSDTSCAITGKPSAMDDCGSFAIGLANELFFELSPGCNYKITREWLIQDQCSLMDTSYTQVIIVKDSIPPVWDQALGSLDTSFICGNDLALPTPPTATDACNAASVSLIADDTINFICADKYTRVLSYEARDNCDNTSIFTVQLSVNDTLAPTADTLPDLGPYNCYNDIPTNNILDVINEIDNCGGAVSVSFVSDSADPGCSGTVDRIYRLTDSCGNSRDIHQRIFIQDTLAPSADPLPTLATVACYLDIPPVNINDVTGETDNCGLTVTVTHVGDSADPGCAGIVTRTYRLTDVCNNSSDITQTFMINDSLPPTANLLQDIGPIDCYDNIPMQNVNDVLGAIDNCGGIVTVNFVEDGPNPGCSGIVLRSYELVDSCGNADTIFQNIIILDDVAPTADPLPFLGSFACYDSLPNPDISLVQNEMDNCDSMVVVSFLDDSANPGCTGIVTRRYQLTDICGNVSELTQTAFINDSIPPVLSCPSNVVRSVFPTDNTQCQRQVDLNLATATDNCGANVSITNDMFPAGGADASGIYPVGTTTVIFTATDNCNNTSTCSTIVTVRDISPPIVNCANLNFTLSPGDSLILKPEDLDAGTMDECSNFSAQFQVVSGSEVSFVDSLIFDCADEGDHLLLIFFTNEFGAISICSGSICIECTNDVCVNGPPFIGGTIFTPTADLLENVSVYISEDMNDMHYTELSGFFSFENIPMGSNVTIEPKKNDDLLNGVSTYDLVLMSKHILNIAPIIDPYLLIAADIDNSGDISVFDILALRKAILHIATDFPNNESWRFMAADHLISNPANPYAFPEHQSINNLNQPELNINFRAIKIGDLNVNAIPNNLLATIVRNSGSELFFEVEDRWLESDEEFSIAFKAIDFQAIQAFQASFEFEQNALEFLSWEKAQLENLDATNFSFDRIKDGLLTWSWFDLQPTSFADGNDLFSLKFKTKTAGRLSDWMTINSRLTTAEAYDTTGMVMPLQLRFKKGNYPIAAADFVLFQNTPNPFSQNTKISFYVAQRERLALLIYDETGNLIYRKEDQFEKGYHEIFITEELLPKPGIYFYQLQSDRFQASQKMILLKE